MKKNIPWKLIISYLKHNLNPEEETLFKQWIIFPENLKLLQELELVWNEVRSDSVSYNPDTSYYWKELQSRMKKSHLRQYTFSIRSVRVAMIAASLILLFSLSLSFFAGHKYNTPDSNILSYSTMSGKSKVILPDSTVVWLNNGTTLTYNSSFADNRKVSLNGEAFFKVKKDREHPFIVSADKVRIKVYGTQFNVNAYPENNDVKVALILGSVSVTAEEENKETLMRPGEIAWVNKQTRKLRLEKADVSFESFWAGGSIVFEAKSLAYISKYLEKWYNCKIILDPSLSSLHAYTFTIKDEPLEVILRIMSSINPISYSFDKNNVVTIKNVEPPK